MGKYSIKIILKILIILMFLIVIENNQSYAYPLTDIINSGQNFIDEGKAGGSAINSNQFAIDSDQLKESSNLIYNILLGIGVILSVLVGAILGIKIMWGSIEEQTKAKEALIPYVLGCVVIFGAFGIWKLAVTVFAQL